MAHMPTTEQPAGGAVGGATVLALVEYTATGSEGTNFLVPIGEVLDTVDYEITWSPKGVVSVVPILDLPDGVGDRTTTYFRVYSVAALTAGDKLMFVLYEV